jgi:NADPH:quinone reductase-like Zn-dependent oxidoreductase
MKAVVVETYDSIDGISIKEIEMPGISAGEVRVKIGAAAVGFVDGLKVQGLYQTKDPLPFVPGTEFAGIVDATADDVTAFKPGMPVIGMTRSGALAEYMSVASAALKNLPATVSFEAGASFQANYLTGLYALTFARVKRFWCWALWAVSASRPYNSENFWARGSSRRLRRRKSANSPVASALTTSSTTRSRIGATHSRR